MRSKWPHFMMLIAIFSSAVLAADLASAQKSAPQPSQPANISVDAKSNTAGRNPSEERQHCFKSAPGSHMIFTISAADSSSPLRNGRVTVEINNLSLLDQARTYSLSKPDVSPGMKYELAAATIKDGHAKVIFKGDANKASAGPGNTTIHLGSLDPMEVPVTTPYANVAWIIISNPRKAANAVGPMKYIYAYQVWTKSPSECTQKP